MAKEKTTGFFFKMSPKESALFEKRMAQTGIANKSAFIRKMCIDGHVINLDMAQLDEIGRLLRITANNVNQLAKRVNSGGEAYRQDVTEVNGQLTEIRKDFGKLLSVLSDVVSPKPGKRFIPPPRITDAGYSDMVTADYPEMTAVELETSVGVTDTDKRADAIDTDYISDYTKSPIKVTKKGA